jgi:hypothetical protein
VHLVLFALGVLLGLLTLAAALAVLAAVGWLIAAPHRVNRRLDNRRWGTHYTRGDYLNEDPP